MEEDGWPRQRPQSGPEDGAPAEAPAISEKATRLAAGIGEAIREFTTAEKHYLYLKLFQGAHVEDPLRQPLNPLGSRSEINRTISWIRTHLEEDSQTSLPKQQVYDEYSDYCIANEIKSLSQADFGKVMKQVYPKVRARRLGTRGNSRYCYSGLRRAIQLQPPQLPDLADKPLSTEAPCTASTLTAAAWLIVKEWAEAHFRAPFDSLAALARFLLASSAVSGASEAAAALQAPANGRSRHRALQLQLQRKIQARCETRERKRRASPRPPRGKRARRSVDTPTGESSTSTVGSTSTSPVIQKPICDKSNDFTDASTTTATNTSRLGICAPIVDTQVGALPDFGSFQKPVMGESKVAIPRLGRVVGKVAASPKKMVKYKTIQPKPEQLTHCDNASYNPHPSAEQIRSQGVLDNVDRFKDKRVSDEEGEGPVFPLPRERLDSISNVDKDAMDEYLGTNNSQHEEELTKYFSNNVDHHHQPHDDTAKLSQLRLLLNKNSAPAAPPAPAYAPPPRRVSFGPGSPAARRDLFSFTPISPGPRSPASPFAPPPAFHTPTNNNNVYAARKRSPPATSKSMLAALLHSNGRVNYTPDYAKSAGVLESAAFFAPDAPEAYRSQSVPLHQMARSAFEPGFELGFDQLPAAVERIIDSLGEAPPAARAKEMALLASSRSYPSTPLVGGGAAFEFGDLLGGQAGEGFMCMGGQMGGEEEFDRGLQAGEFDGGGLMDENGVLIVEQSFNN